MKFQNIPYHILKGIGFYREIPFRVNISTTSGAESPFYIARRAARWGDSGFFANYFVALYHFFHATRLGFRPVIDMRNYKTLYSEKHPVNGTMNAWNYYFLQPHDTAEAYGSGRFILSNAIEPPLKERPIRETDTTCEFDPESGPPMRRLAMADLSIRPELRDAFDEEFSRLFRARKVLGIHFRGGDRRNPPPGHWRAVRQEDIARAAEQIKECSPDAVFLASDENGMAELLSRKLELPVTQLPGFRLPPGSQAGVHWRGPRHRKIRKNHRYLLGLEVLKDAYFLSKCNWLVHGHSNVANAAIFFRGKPYERKILVASGKPTSWK